MAMAKHKLLSCPSQVLACNQLTGTLPSFVGNLTKLTSLMLYSNYFVGGLLRSWGPLQVSNNTSKQRLVSCWLKLCLLTCRSGHHSRWPTLCNQLLASVFV
jgi:hypothetical protein